MSDRVRVRRKVPSIRQLAEEKLAATTTLALENMTPDEIRRVVHELEVHQVELEIQNQQLEEAQREAELSKERYRHLYESAPIGYLTLDADGVVLLANLCAAKMLRVPRTKLVGRKLASLVAAAHQDRWHFARRALVENGERRTLELSLELDDGTPLEVGLTAADQGNPSGHINLGMLDMTDLRRSERALRKAATAAALAEQHERRKLASDLHDDAGQLIALASIKLRALTTRLKGDPARELAELSGLLDQTRQRITSLSFQMSPPLLHDIGLIAAVRWLAEDVERNYGLAVTVVDGPEPPLDEVTRITLFQAIRELLINVKKHSKVDAASVQVWRDGVMVRVAVEDRGIGLGFDRERGTFGRPQDRTGFGLLALRERLKNLGGSLEVGSCLDGSGTRIVISMPLPSTKGDST